MKGLVVAANRLPVEVSADGTLNSSPGGLASALSSVTAAGTHWIGWAGPDADARTKPFAHGDLQLHPVALSTDEVDRYYQGFANSILWPLFHGRLRRVELNRAWWHSYRIVNRRFATAACRIAPQGGTVWVHDYHLLLTPALIRAKRPDLRIGLFLHIPFPNAQLFSMLPWRKEVIKGMLGADVLGFQVPDDVDNFVAAAERIVDARVRGSLMFDGVHTVDVDAFPISVDFAQWDSLGDESQEQAARQRKELGVESIFLGIDRLDYTKGITVRLRAFQELLEDGAIDPEEVVFVQVAVPSRERIGSYAEERRRVNNIVGEINGRFGRIGRPSVHLVSRSLPMTELQPLYRTADVMLVTPVRDGMNLVAKEFVASCVNESGVLILSEFAGAAHELTDALKVNPFDIDGVKAALVEALAMSPEEQQRRMRSMRALVKERDVHAWALGFIQRLEKRRRS